MTANKKVAVILSGCGVYDGAEIHESVFTLWAIAKSGASYTLFAPDINQYHVVNHFDGTEMKESRNVLTEAARIARGQIKPLREYKAAEFDALLIPGGFGVAKNLSDFAFKGSECEVNTDVERAILETHANKKPMGALCISPAIIARILNNVEVTIGNDEGTAKAITQMGAHHKTTTHGEVIIDKKNKVATTPCYMLDATILQIAQGAENIVNAVMKMA